MPAETSTDKTHSPMEDEPAFSSSIDYELEGHQLQIRGRGPDLRDMLLDLIDGARRSLKLYYYLFADDESGHLVLAKLVEALKRGVDVTLMLDAFGSLEVKQSLFDQLTKAGGRVAWFGSSWSTRYLIRNHQKIAISDDRKAIIGGFNISNAYFGVPENEAWHDMGIRIEGPQVETLCRWYEQLWQWVSTPNQSFRALRGIVRSWHGGKKTFRWLIGGPTYGLSPWARTVRSDLEKARRLDLVTAYFSPGNRMLARLRQVAQRGNARIVFAARSDNTATVAAARLLYGSLLRAGTRIYEYQPSKLHMKLMVIDNAVYIGSANFDMRSLFLNLEIMLRIEDATFADRIVGFIDERARASDHITARVHRERKTPFRWLKGWISYLLVGILDYKITRRLNFRE